MHPNLSRTSVTFIVFYFACQVDIGSPNGQFYVGFLGYANLHNLNYEGKCCDGQLTESGCLDFCDLVFEVSVSGIDSDPASGKRPSEVPIDNDNAILFPSSYEGVINPMTFDFRKWTGHVNITVDVYDIDENESEDGAPELVDRFLFDFSHEGPSLDFIYKEQIGQRPNSPSELRMVFRYGCDPFYYGQNCLIDCLVHPNNAECPDTSGVTDWMLLTTTPRGTTDRRCGFTRKPQTSDGGNSTGSQSELCGNGTTLSTEGTTVETKQSTASQHVATATTDTLNVPNSITFTDSLSSTIQPQGSSGTQNTSFTTRNVIQQHSETTSPYTGNTVSMVIPKSTTTTEETRTTKQASSPSSTSKHTAAVSTEKAPHLEISSLPPKTDILYTTGAISGSKPTLYNTNQPVASTDSHVQSLDHFSTVGIGTTNGLDSSSELNTGRHTGSTSNIQSSTSRQTDVIGGGSSSNNNNGAVIRQVTLSQVSSMTSGTTTDAGSNPTVSDDGDAMDYWPAIVGGVLGALVLVAIIAFIFYYRKQKALRKRQDIYNVNPKRWALQPPQENGTTVKSDVALETEQV